MLKSMTGFGKSEATANRRRFTVEIKSVNSKQLDLTLKSPGSVRPLEMELRALVAPAVVRGKVELSVFVESTADQTPAAGIDAEKFAAAVQQLRTLADGMRIDDDTLFKSALRLPEVVASPTYSLPVEDEYEALMTTTREALERFDAFRAQEGAALLKDLEHRVGLIERFVAEVTPYETARAGVVRARILEQIAALGLTPDTGRLEQEMIFYIERLDITEEKVRLLNHCRYFREVAEERASGRKLGFIAQEMGREINTLGSKANEQNIQRLVVQMKDELEKIKEQLLNIL